MTRETDMIPHLGHDPAVLEHARAILDACDDTRDMQRAVVSAVERNERWRGSECLNLIAAESPTSPLVRQLLSAEVGIRATGGHIGRKTRCFAGTHILDELEALAIELLKRLLECEYVDHRLMGGMAGCLAVYTALAEPGDIVMTVPEPVGGDSSNRHDGPPGARGLKVVDLPFDPEELEVDLELFRKMAPLVRPKIVGLGMTMALFPFPLAAMRDIVADWGGKMYFDAAHQLGLIAGRCYQHPLAEGADIMTGSGGKTFSGPQSGVIAWNDQSLTDQVVDTIFPMLTGSHQANRVAALAVSAIEQIAYGEQYMGQVVKNAKSIAAALDARGVPMLCSHKGYTETHQVMFDAQPYGGGFETAERLAEANIIVNKMLLPRDQWRDVHRPSGVRLGVVELTRLGMKSAEMETVADFIARLLVNKEPVDKVLNDVRAFREPFQTLYFHHGTGLPPT